MTGAFYSAMLLSALLSPLPEVRPRSHDADPNITAVTADSRRVMPGALFVALRGDNFDGHQFIPDAIARGAVAIVAEHPLTPAPLSPALGRGGGVGVRGIVVPDSRIALGWLSRAWDRVTSR